jgi:hypothetical protein
MDETNVLYENAVPHVQLVNQEIADLKIKLAQETEALLYLCTTLLN